MVPDLSFVFGSAVTSCVACSSSPLPCPLLQHLRCGTLSMCGMLGALPDETFLKCEYVPILEASCGTTTTNSASPITMQWPICKEKEIGPSPLACRTHHCHLGFHFALRLIVGYFDLSFPWKFVQLHAVGPSVLFFFGFFYCTCSAHHRGWSCLSFIILILSTPGTFLMQSSRRSLYRGTLDCSMVIHMTSPSYKRYHQKDQKLVVWDLVYHVYDNQPVCNLLRWQIIMCICSCTKPFHILI